mgnify:CR=1 FL=1
MYNEYKRINDEINSILFNGKGELSESEQEKLKQLYLEQDELKNKATYPYKLGGHFYIELENLYKFLVLMKAQVS